MNNKWRGRKMKEETYKEKKERNEKRKYKNQKSIRDRNRGMHQ